jgi:hypothetical protein
MQVVRARCLLIYIIMFSQEEAVAKNYYLVDGEEEYIAYC